MKSFRLLALTAAVLLSFAVAAVAAQHPTDRMQLISIKRKSLIYRFLISLCQ